MRHVLTSLALFATFAAAGQVNGFQLPYNPDVEPDGFIGVGDILELLVLFGNQFSPENVYVNVDSSHVALNQGQMNFFECSAECASLEGSWRMANELDFGFVWEGLPVDQYFWLNNSDYHYGNGYTGTGTVIRKNPSNINGYSKLEDGDVHCLCATRERPKVEYLVLDPMESIYNDSAVEFEPWLNDKAQEGWRLMPTPAGYAEPGTWVVLWRWAE